MKRQWHVRHQVVEHPEGQLRWDRAYQALLRWTQSDLAPPQLPPVDPSMTLEVDHACSSVCTGVDPTSGTGSDH